MESILLCSYVFLLCQTAQGLQLPFSAMSLYDDSSTPKVVEDPDIFASGSSEIFNTLERRTENGLSKEENSTHQNSWEVSTDTTKTSSPHATTDTPTSTAVLGNESQPQNTSYVDTIYGETPDATVLSPSNEDEQVARGKSSITETNITTSQHNQSLYQKTWALISDTYTLSILVPVAAGVVFATTIILTIAFCRCLKRCCMRRRLRKKGLPDSVKNLRPSDRARLLAESSDDEF